MGQDVHIMLQGQNEGIDPRVLPDGALSSLTNARIRRDGRVQSRYGYDFIAGSAAALSNTVLSFQYGAQTLAFAPRTALATPAAAYLLQGTTWTSLPTTTTSPALGGVAGGVKRYALPRGSQTLTTPDSVIDSQGHIWYAAGRTSALAVDVWCVEPATHRVLLSATIAVGSAMGAPYLVAAGDHVAAIYNCADSIHMNTWNVTTFAVVVSDYALFFTHTSCGANFAAGPIVGSSTDCVVVAQTDATNISILRITITGLLAPLIRQQDVTGTTPVLSIIARQSDNTIGVAWTRGGGDALFAMYSLATGVTLTAPTVIGALATGRPLIGSDTTGGTAYYAIAWNKSTTTTSDTLTQTLRSANIWHQNGGTATISHSYFVSRPTTIGAGLYAWAQGSVYGFNHSSACTMRLYSFVDATSNVAAIEAIAMQLEAVLHTWAGGGIPTLASTETPSQVDAFFPVPTYSGLEIRGLDAIRVSFGANVIRSPGVQINGQAIVPGSIAREWSGANLVESGLLEGPQNVRVAAGSGAGSVTAGAHSYVVVWQWTDSRGRRYLSPPSAAASITAAGGGSVVVGFDGPAQSAKTGLVALVYRTTAGGTVYYHLPTQNTAIAAATASQYFVTDVSADTGLQSQPVLYTQGDRGSLSGLLQNDPPPAARFAWASSSRVILGGLESSDTVQWSKLVYAGEPLAWSVSAAYRATVQGDVTGVAWLDGTWLVFTADTIWEFAGDGPDDMGAGSFSEARKRPSDTGCISHASIVETGQGLMFQGTNGGLWLLPRGGNAPVWIGQPVRTTLDSYPVITGAAFVSEENCAYWSCSNTARTASVLVVYDVRNGQWSVDTGLIEDINAMSVHDGALLLNGRIRQTPGVYADDWTGSASSAIQMQIVTGDMRPFGVGGWGRCRLMHLAGELRSSKTELTAEISYDSGQTWTDLYRWFLEGSAGDAIDYQFGPSRVRGCDYRVRITSTPQTTSATAAMTGTIVPTPANFPDGSYFYLDIDGVTYQVVFYAAPTSLAQVADYITGSDAIGHVVATLSGSNHIVLTCSSPGEALTIRSGTVDVSLLGFVSGQTETGWTDGPGEGIALNAISLDLHKSQGVRRVPAAQRG